jgi:tetratricopeptide (TPR) repeat protein
MPMVMDVGGRMSPVNGDDRRQRTVSFQVAEENMEETETSPSRFRIPRFVKSLVSGSSPGPDYNYDSEYVVIDPKHRIEERSKSRTSTTSPTSILASIGACAGIDSIGASFLNEGDEESRFEYGFGGAFRRRCNGSPQRDEDDDDEKETEELMVQFTKMMMNAGAPLAKSRTPVTEATTQDEPVAILNSRDNTITVESIGSGRSSRSVKFNEFDSQIARNAFASARKLLFGGNSEVDWDNTATSSSLRCHIDRNVLRQCSDRIPCPNGRNPCPNNQQIEAPKAVPPRGSPNNSGRSFARSTFTTDSMALYAAAYGDDGSDNGNHPEEKKIDEIQPEPASLMGVRVHSLSGKSYTTAGIEHDHGQSQIQYWRQRLNYASKHHGKSHSSTADAYFNLGRAQLNVSPHNNQRDNNGTDNPYSLPTKQQQEKRNSQQKHQYDLAIENLTIARGIWERTHGPDHLAVARALDSLALAIVKKANHDRSTTVGSSSHTSSSNGDAIQDDLHYAKRLLEDAFSIRVHHLGAWHVDTVETYNKLAGVLLHLGLLKEACRAYREVYLVRRAIFGAEHPSVAISAHSLANCYYRRGKLQDSLVWYKISLEVYEEMGLSYRHPAVTQLLKDQSRLEAFMHLETV